MPDSLTGLLDPTRILFDLQQGNEIAQGFSGCMEPEEIARRVTNGLVEKFDCAFARIWVLEPDQTTLKLVASSGLYTHTNGSFARVPIGAYRTYAIAPLAPLALGGTGFTPAKVGGSGGQNDGICVSPMNVIPSSSLPILT